MTEHVHPRIYNLYEYSMLIEVLIRIDNTVIPVDSDEAKN